MTYTFHCQHCRNEFDRSVAVEFRDDTHVCEYCGCGAKRIFTPSSNIVCPERFRLYARTDLEPSKEDCYTIEKRNDAYLANKPKAKPEFKDILKKELDSVGYRNPL